MGAVCSKKVPHDCPSNQPGESHLHISSPQQWPSPLHLNPDAIFIDTASSPLSDIADTKTEKLQSTARKRQAYTLEHETSSEKDYVEAKSDQIRLSRLLSHKAKAARTRTSAVAKKGAAKVSEVGLLLGRAGTAGLEKAVEALDTVGSSLTTLGSGFATGTATKGIKIGILAFEVANTIVKGFNLIQALSDDDVRSMKEEILPSEAVQHLVSKDFDELWSIAAADKRNDLRIFTREVVRFGNQCRDPQWHQLSRVFENFLGLSCALLLPEPYINIKISAKRRVDTKLGTSGLALHYANIINQIDNLASRPGLVPPNTRDALYQGLPPNVKVSLRSRLSKAYKDDELTAVQIKAEMETILDWLAPYAVNTTRAHRGFGWVGEWAIKGAVIDRRLAGSTELSLLQTLHHADQTMTESYILDLLVWLHLLVSRARNNMNGHKTSICSPAQKQTALPTAPLEKPSMAENCQLVKTDALLSQEDQEILSSNRKTRKRHSGMSRSQEFNTVLKRSDRICNRLSKSNSHSPSSTQTLSFPCKMHHTPMILSLDLDIDRINEIDLKPF